MPEGSTTPERTTGEATRKKPKKKKPRQRIPKLEDKFRPRAWGWWVLILSFLQVIGFCNCQSPSVGWHFKQWLINYLSMTVIPFCRQLMSFLCLHLPTTIGPSCWQMLSSLSSYLYHHSRVIISQAFRTVLKYYTWTQGRDFRVNSISYISHLGYLFRYGFSKYLLPVILILCNGGSCAMAQLRKWDLRAILPFVVVFGTSAFWKRSELKGQLVRAKLNLKISIKKTRLLSTSVWLVTTIIIAMTLLFLALVYWFKVADREAFWEWTDGAR